MPLVVAMRKWKKENFKTATRKVIEAWVNFQRASALAALI